MDFKSWDSKLEIVWIVGPLGCGKSTLAEKYKSSGYEVVNSDVALERLMQKFTIPFDTRTHNPIEKKIFSQLRTKALDKTWEDFHSHINNLKNIVIETTGNKPALLKKYVDKLESLGYNSCQPLT